MPYQDPPLNEEDNHGVDIEDNQPNPVDDDDEDSDVGGDNTQPPMVPTSSNVNAKKRKIVGKGDKKVGVAEKLQKTLDHIADGMDKISQATGTRAKVDDPYSLEKCLLALDEVPGLIEGSLAHLLATRILATKENRITFCYYMQHKRHLAYDWLGTFTEKHIPRPHRFS